MLSSCFRRRLGHLGLVTLSDVNETSSTEKLLLSALVVSVMLHLLAFSLWRVGQAQGWWQNMTLPRWMQVAASATTPLTPKKPAQDLLSQTQLTFVEVDPALAAPEPPKKPMFQGAQNTVAANPEIKLPSDMPNIDGSQEKFLKTIENAKPTPKRAAPAPSPAASQPENLRRQSAPKQSYVPGDLALARPSDKTQEGKSDAETSDETQPQPVHQRPRTINEALARNGIPGQRTHHVGGVGKVDPNISLDVQGTPLGIYLAQMVEAVRARWNQLLENETAYVTGRVELRFRLHPDGRISSMKVQQNEVSDLLETKCEQAITDPSPYAKWPREMRLELPNDFYDITFTFYYEP